MIKKISLSLGMLASVILISGCGEKSLVENKVERQVKSRLGEEGNVQFGQDSINIKTEQGSMQVGENVTLPSGFPSDVYIIDGQITSAIKNISGQGYQVAIKSSASLKEVRNLYESKLKEQKWTVEVPFENGPTIMIFATKDKRQIVISAGEQTGESGVVVVLSVSE